jgi:uncharacterized FAD-dependent dehydrogenase
MNRFDAIIVGAGPAGIFAALELLKHEPKARIAILERGRLVKDRACPKSRTIKCVHCKPCGITTGVGGAGTFSDGKLSLSPEVGGRMTDYIGESNTKELIEYVDNVYLEHGGNKTVYYDEDFAQKVDIQARSYGLKLIKCPIRHLGTENSARIMDELYRKIASHPNIFFKTNTFVKHLDVLQGEVKGVLLEKATEIDNHRFANLYSENVIVAVGRSGSNWLYEECKRQSVKLKNNEIDIGVRIELPRYITDNITDKLYEFKLIHYSNTFEDKVRTFCMNPGGFVSQENYDDGLALVNGHCYDKVKSDNTNFALLVSSQYHEPFDDPISYGKYIAKLANMLTGGGIMVQRLEDIKKGRKTTYERLKRAYLTPTLKDAVPGDLCSVLPYRHMMAILETLEVMDNICPGIYGKDTLLYGIEAKFYSSRVEVDKNLQSQIKGLYFVGDGAGITRGVIQASISGVVAARSIIGKQISTK